MADKNSLFPNWHFKPLEAGDTVHDPIQGEFFSTKAIENSADAFVREGIQNSLDARRAGEPLRVRIRISGPGQAIPSSSTEWLLRGNWEHILVPGNGLREPPQPSDLCCFVTFEDFGTSGLEGDPRQWRKIAGQRNNFFNFFRAEGHSDKSETDRGRWGVDGSGLTQIEQDRGLWAWLALFYYEELCPPGKKGQRKPGENARWVPESGRAFRYYRHLLAGPYRIYREHRDHPEQAMIVLCGPLDSPGDLVEQLASRQELVTNGALLATASALYLDPENGLPKRGVVTTEKAGGRRRGKPGTVFRLIDVCRQYDVAWDLYAMAPEAVVEMLPKEFDRFRE